MSELLKRRAPSAEGAAGFPQVRLRRMRQSATLRSMVRETVLTPSDFVYPLFVTHGQGVRTPILPMPGQFQVSIDNLLKEAAEAQSLGVPAVLLFGVPSDKDGLGTEAYDDHGIIQEATRAIKQAMPDMVVITDVCLCEYTDHGHCGVLTHDGVVDNDSTLELLAHRRLASASGRRHRGTFGDDGRPDRGLARRVGRRGHAGSSRHGLRLEIHVGVLRTLPNRR